MMHFLDGTRILMAKANHLPCRLTRSRTSLRASFSSSITKWVGGVSMVQGASRGIGLEFVTSLFLCFPISYNWHLYFLGRFPISYNWYLYFYIIIHELFKMAKSSNYCYPFWTFCLTIFQSRNGQNRLEWTIQTGRFYSSFLFCFAFFLANAKFIMHNFHMSWNEDKFVFSKHWFMFSETSDKKSFWVLSICK